MTTYKLPIPSLMTLNHQNNLQPIDDFYGQVGLFELDSNGDLMPITGIEVDFFFELNGNAELQPK